MLENILHTLIVDDNYFNRDLCILALDHLGLTYETAEDGIEALELLDNHSFDLVLLDLAMPRLGGRGMIDELVKRGIREDFVIVVITAHSHLADDIQELADFVMYKPIDIQLFSRFLQRINVEQLTS